MLKTLLATSLMFLTVAAQAQAASSLVISKNSDFSSPTTNFEANQTIYVKVSANSDGSKKHDLNLRDNQYNLIQTYNLEGQGGNQFKGSLPAPQNSGYYTLEARIEAEGSVTSSTRTIKVGETNNANSSVKVNVNVSTGDQSVLGNKSSPSPIPSNPSPTSEESALPTPSPTPDANTLPGSDIDFSENEGIFKSIIDFFKNLFGGIF